MRGVHSPLRKGGIKVGECDVMLTEGMFEASKVLAEAICRGKAKLMFFGYATGYSLTISGGSSGRGKGIVISKGLGENFVITKKVSLKEYKAMKWDEMKKIAERR